MCQASVAFATSTSTSGIPSHGSTLGIWILHTVCLAHVELEGPVQHAMDTEDELEGQWPAEEGGTELEAEAEEGELEEGKLAEAAELEAEEGELEGSAGFSPEKKK